MKRIDGTGVEAGLEGLGERLQWHREQAGGGRPPTKGDGTARGHDSGNPTVDQELQTSPRQ